MDELLPAVVGGIVGSLSGWIAAAVSSYWGPRKLEEWRARQLEEKIRGPRKELLLELLHDTSFEFRYLDTLSKATGTSLEECRLLLIEAGARGSVKGARESWQLKKLEADSVVEQ